MVTRNLAIMFTEIRGCNPHRAASHHEGPEAPEALRAQYERLLLPLFHHFGGTIVNTTGDAFLVSFDSPTDAVRCGGTIQELLRQYNQGLGQGQEQAQRLEGRVAIDLGEVGLGADEAMVEVTGEAVPLAARLGAETPHGEVWFTDALYQAVDRASAPSVQVGERRLAGGTHPTPIYRLRHDVDSELVRELAQGVRLVDGVVQLAGIRGQAHETHEVTANASRCRRTVLASLAVLSLSALVVWWIPSGEELALEKGRQLLAEGSPADALLIAHKVLATEPQSERVKALAIDAARAQLDKLVVQGDIKAAEGWLQRQLEVKPYLEPLRAEVMRLDARDTVSAVLNEPRYDAEHHPQPLQQFLSRYPQSGDAPYHVASLLPDAAVTPQTRLWLLRTALERGHPADEPILQLHLAQLAAGDLDRRGQESVREVVRNYYPEQGRRWAQGALEGDNVQAFMHGWALLKGSGAAQLDDPYYQSLHRLLHAYQLAPLQQGRAVLSGQRTAKRQGQVVAFLGALVDSYPKFISGRELRDEIARLQTRLRQEWQR